MSTQDQTVESLRGFRVSAFRILPRYTVSLELFFALAVGWTIWHLPPPASIGDKGLHFLATLSVGVLLWVFEVFDEYIVALMLLLSWVVLGIVPSKVALAGFSHSSWFFVVAVLGIAAAVNKSGLLYRLAVKCLSRFPHASYRTHTFFLLASGLFITPLLPTGKARAAIALPISQSLSAAMGFKPRSNGSAGLALAALIGFSQMSFLFLTGGEFCLIGWNLLPGAAREEFGWTAWFLASVPVGAFITFFVAGALHFLFPVNAEHQAMIPNRAVEPQLESPLPMSKPEWISLAVLAMTLIGWLTMPLHGINEAWVALAGLLMFLTTRTLDEKTFKTNVNWGLILFYGIVISIATISTHLKVDRWLTEIINPVIAGVSFSPVAFLLTVILAVFVARLFLRKAPVVMIFILTLVPLGQHLGIHPGVVLLTILVGCECFFLPYQDGPYQIAYSTTEGQAFSHAQARKILAAKFIATLAAVAISVPYWRLLGLIE